MMLKGGLVVELRVERARTTTRSGSAASVVRRYIRNAELFDDNAAAGIGL